MNGHILILSGNIQKDNGEVFNEEAVFELLEDNGFEFSGLANIISGDEINNTISEIVDYIELNEVEDMLYTHNYNYDYSDTYEDLKECLICNTGTSIYNDIVTSALSEDLIEKYNKYSKSNWEVSDEFQAKLSDKLVEKIDTLILGGE